jgi:hypothetical protein
LRTLEESGRRTCKAESGRRRTEDSDQKSEVRGAQGESGKWN